MDDILINIYQEANDHLRTSDNKRDQIIAFYFVILGLLLSSLNKITKLPYVMQILIYISIGFFGCILVFIVHKFRFWHIIYVNTAVVIQNLVLSKIQPNEKNIKEVWDLYQKSVEKIQRQPNTENLTFVAFLLVAFIPFDLLLCLLKLNFMWIILIHSIAIIVIYLLCHRDLKRMLSIGYQASWMLRMDLLQKTQEKQNIT
ncbi:MAG: hypothetical protein HRF40_14570 [Nitrososphaera sp.]|jgi:hypothetical protein